MLKPTSMWRTNWRKKKLDEESLIKCRIGDDVDTALLATVVVGASAVAAATVAYSCFFVILNEGEMIGRRLHILGGVQFLYVS